MVKNFKRFFPILGCLALILAMLLPLPISAAVASDHVTESSGDGFVLYNGVKLPELPEWDREKYPYAVLVYGTGDSVPYWVYFCSNQPYINSSDKVVINEKTGGTGLSLTGTKAIYYRYYNLENTVGWEDSPSYSDLLSPISISKDRVFWGNADILNTDGTVYLGASDPIPLDGMTVIEWDGDTTGLDVVDDIYYRISDSVWNAAYPIPVSVVTDSSGINPSLVLLDNDYGADYIGLIDNQDDIVGYVVSGTAHAPSIGTYLAKWNDSTYTSLLAFSAEHVEPTPTTGTIPAGQYNVKTLVMTGEMVDLPAWPDGLTSVDFNFVSNATKLNKMWLGYNITYGDSIFYGADLRAYSYGLVPDGTSCEWSDPVYAAIYVPADQEVPAAFYDWFMEGFTRTGDSPADPQYTVTVNIYSNNGLTLHDSYSASSYTAAPALTIDFLSNGLSISDSSSTVFSWADSSSQFAGFSLRSLATTPSFLSGQHMTIGGRAASVTVDLYVVHDDGYASPIDVDFVGWLVPAVGSFLSFELWPGLSLDSVLWVSLVIGVLFWFLKCAT